MALPANAALPASSFAVKRFPLARRAFCQLNLARKMLLHSFEREGTPYSGKKMAQANSLADFFEAGLAKSKPGSRLHKRLEGCLSEAHYLCAFGHHTRGETQESLQHLGKAISCRKDFAALHALRAVVCLELGMENEAIGSFQRAIRLMTKDGNFELQPLIDRYVGEVIGKTGCRASAIRWICFDFYICMVVKKGRHGKDQPSLDAQASE